MRDGRLGVGGGGFRGRSGTEGNDDGPGGLPLPSATRKAAVAWLDKCGNVGLLFDRYIRFYDPWGLEAPKKTSGKLLNLQKIVVAQQRCQTDRVWKQFHQQAIERWMGTVRSRAAEPFRMMPQWRFITGLGEKTALEVGFRFHQLYGFPIIPGSGLKGLARMVALWEIGEAVGVKRAPLSEARRIRKAGERTDLEKLEDRLLSGEGRANQRGSPSDQTKTKASAVLDLWEGAPASVAKRVGLFRRVFGTPQAEGQAVFFDAVPAVPPILEVDIMNVHFGDYYQDGKNQVPPADYLNPTPIPFLAVGRSPFLFAVGWHGNDDGGAQEQAIEWLKKGLTGFGAGAKTAAGYGYFIDGERTRVEVKGLRVEGEEPVVAKPHALASRAEGIAPQPSEAPPLNPEPSTLNPIVEHRGIVREYRPDKGIGRLADEETGEELTFRREAVLDRGWSPGKKSTVLYTVEDREGCRSVLTVRKGR
ncbi:MAG: type III-B CRISPR module RAMP protein Cmr6 [Chloroflexi bacterium]|nr:type III-B CRISPR module RAMP protein Cmr6 [Chloroflexota bacterium]